MLILPKHIPVNNNFKWSLNSPPAVCVFITWYLHKRLKTYSGIPQPAIMKLFLNNIFLFNSQSFPQSHWPFLISRGRMANFKGHALPGTFFLLFGLWWSIKSPFRQKRRRERRGDRDNQSLTLLFNRTDLVEGALKIFFAFVGELQNTYSGLKRSEVNT